MRTLVLSVEGSIGAGKSTLLKQLEEASFDCEHVVVYEPVDAWMSAKPPGSDKSVFEMYYDDRCRWGYMFQMFVLQTRVQHLAQAVREHPGKVIITERCPLTDCEVFAKMLHDQGVLAPSEFYVYEQWYQFVRSLVPPVDGIIYLRVTPDVCAQRIARRNRSGEGAIDCDYLNSLHTQHDKWLLGLSCQAAISGMPVLEVDGTADGPVNMLPIANFISNMRLATTGC